LSRVQHGLGPLLSAGVTTTLFASRQKTARPDGFVETGQTLYRRIRLRARLPLEPVDESQAAGAVSHTLAARSPLNLIAGIAFVFAGVRGYWAYGGWSALRILFATFALGIVVTWLSNRARNL
jgi:hypothetical protein